MEATILESATKSLTSKIDRFAVLDAKIKELEETTKALKAEIANEFGEGKHRGEKYGVTISLTNTSKVDYKALLAEFGATPEQIAKHTTKGASIRVSATA